MTPQALIDFENEIEQLFLEKKIKAPIHLSGGNEEQLIEIFKLIDRKDYVLSTWRSHYHALLHGITPHEVKRQILAGHSMSIFSLQPRFMASAIVGSMPSIGVGIAIALKRLSKDRKVWCFIGDMGACTGAYCEALNYAENFHLPINFVIEDNGVSVDTPTKEAWGVKPPFWKWPIINLGNEIYQLSKQQYYYKYKRKYPHVGSLEWVSF